HTYILTCYLTFFFFNDTPHTVIYTLSLHDALPIFATQYESEVVYEKLKQEWNDLGVVFLDTDSGLKEYPELFEKYFGKIIPYTEDRKSTRLNSSHVKISYAVFCLKKKNK